jgi:hypothetical protein
VRLLRLPCCQRSCSRAGLTREVGEGFWETVCSTSFSELLTTSPVDLAEYKAHSLLLNSTAFATAAEYMLAPY